MTNNQIQRAVYTHSEWKNMKNWTTEIKKKKKKKVKWSD